MACKILQALRRHGQWCQTEEGFFDDLGIHNLRDADGSFTTMQMTTVAAATCKEANFKELPWELFKFEHI
eukprot:12902122-Prorocentrum_lima.AAC.1